MSVATSCREPGIISGPKRLVQDGPNVVRDIRIAYTDYQLALQQAQLTEHRAALRREIARLAEARLDAGDVPELDVTAIRVDARVGEADAALVVRDVELARQRLRLTLGLQLLNVPISSSPQVNSRRLDFNVDQLVNDALSCRPDLLAIELAANAADQRVQHWHNAAYRN